MRWLGIAHTGMILFCCVAVEAQQTIPLAENEFASCSEVEKTARQFDPGTIDRVYTVELYSKAKGSVALPFPTDNGISPALRWISKYRDNAYPFAMFYSVAGRYKFRCRDSQNRLLESASPGGDPLQIPSTGGTVEILHFKFSNMRMAQVYAVTSMPLEQINAEQLLAEVTQRLDARHVFLYVRNDPWFFGYSGDSIPYIFSDKRRVIDEETYTRSRTWSCMTGHGCRFDLSWR